MREVKFRAWDKKEKCWVEGFNIEGATGWLCLNDANYLPFEPHDRFILSQYTGLKDKNGEDYYYKDIIKINESIFVIEYNFGMFGFYNQLQQWVPLYLWAKIGEVVGNEHENPELLK